MRHHIFADEAGCLAFKKKRGVSRYFILCSITTSSPDIGNDLQDLRRRLSWEGVCDDAFHATTDRQEIRDQVFDLISTMDFRVDATLLEKSKALMHIRASDLTFYKYAWHYHFKHLAGQIISNNDEVHITAASIGTKKQKGAFSGVINDVVRQSSASASHRVSFWQAASDPCIQVADYCAWAIQRKWERNDDRSYELIKEKICSEYDLWRKGKNHYY